MKRTLILSTLALALAGGVAFAQQPDAQPAPAAHHGKHGAHAAAQKMQENLGLTDEQTAKIEPILAERAQKMKAIKADSSLTEDQKRMQSKTVTKDSRSQIEEILTPEQREKMHSMKGKAKEAPAAEQN